MPFGPRQRIQHRAAHQIRRPQARNPLESRIDQQEPVIRSFAVLGVNHLVHGHPIQHGMDQRTVILPVRHVRLQFDLSLQNVVHRIDNPGSVASQWEHQIPTGSRRYAT